MPRGPDASKSGCAPLRPDRRLGGHARRRPLHLPLRPAPEPERELRGRHCDAHAAAGAAGARPRPRPRGAEPGAEDGRNAGGQPCRRNARRWLAGTKLTLTLDGRRLTTLPAGTYKLVAVDTSKALDLSLAQTRGGVTEQPLTTARFTGTKTVTVDLLAGRWKLYSAVGKGVTASFTVTR
jgi:hypothetical protein